nr:hypothetical protein [Tanacetum cinerariifolium]
MQKKFHVAVSKDKAFRAKAKAKVHLKGDVKVQYALLMDYVCELKRCNPYTTVKIDVYGEEDPETPTRMFRRINYLGQMLTAVGVDANNGIYPVAYGIVESENQYSWTWFLKCLGDDFDLYKNSNFTFITNRQKRLLPALEKLFPSAEHMYCRANCDLLINNVCEVLNRQLLDARDSPIITALDFVREYLMQRIVIVQKIIQKCNGPLTPAVAKLFDKIKAASTGCIPEDWFHDSYKLQTWMNVYFHKVNPVNGRDTWSKFDCLSTLLPPEVHPQIGGPPKKRKKSKEEIVMVKGNKLTRQDKTITRSLCQAAGHNKRVCSQAGTQASQRNESVPKETTGTKRTSSVTGTRIAAAEVGIQASQAGVQASTRSTFKRTKKSASRLTPKK